MAMKNKKKNLNKYVEYKKKIKIDTTNNTINISHPVKNNTRHVNRAMIKTPFTNDHLKTITIHLTLFIYIG